MFRSSELVVGALALSLVTAALGAAAASGHVTGGTPVALVTVESKNEVLAVSLPGGKVLRRVHVADPQAITAAVTGPAVVVNPHGVTLLDSRSLRVLAVLRDFRAPQIAAITPDGEWVYVTDAATGQLSVIELLTRRVVDRLYVGAGAHHLAVSPDFQHAWIALGETAHTIVVLDTSKANRPRVVRRLHPRTAAHDLAFAPNSRTVWVSSATASYVAVFNASNGRLAGTLPAGPGPQHIAFGPYVHPRAYITSGYGSSLEMVDIATERVLRRVRAPYGSFNLATAGGLVVTSSLLDGRVSEYTTTLHRWMTVKLAPATRAVAISIW